MRCTLRKNCHISDGHKGPCSLIINSPMRPSKELTDLNIMELTALAGVYEYGSERFEQVISAIEKKVNFNE